MTALAVCCLAFGAAYLIGKRSLAYGIITVFAVGYFYGILRANLPTTASHFIFDSALLGLYLSHNWFRSAPLQGSGALQGWVLMLTIWPALLMFMPFQPLLVSLVGLRGAVFFLPMALLGARLRGDELVRISIGFAILNLAAVGFATAEYFLGVPRFYPLNAATFIIYASSDVAGGFYRIPATFVAAHDFGGMMVDTLPFLLGLWSIAQNRIERLLAVLGIGAALIGVLMSATRLNFVIGAALILITIWSGRMKFSRRVMFAALIGIVMVVALGNARLQRFKSLSDTGYVEDRIAGSVNRGFFEILLEHPMGNGLGGGGTSIPYFLQGQVKNPMATEDEYARILGEQGVIGLLLWISFIVWFFSSIKNAFSKGPWMTARRLIWGTTALSFITGAIGNGLLTAVPGSAVLLLSVGLVVVSPRRLAETNDGRRKGVKPALVLQRRYQPTPTV